MDQAALMEIKPIRAVLRLKNNAIMERRERLGYESCARFCREMELPYALVVSLESAGNSPFTERGELRKVATELCEALAATPEELWPDEVLALKKNVSTRLLDFDDVALLAGHSVPLLDERSVDDRLGDVEIAERALSCMRERDAYVVKRVVLEGSTIREAGEEIGLSVERTRQLLARGLRDARRKIFRGERNDDLLDSI